jgi:SNF2 family DNA or RNA helicase
MILTGTPVTKKKRIFDIYSQWKFLNPQSPLLFDVDGVEHTLKTFKEEYGVWTTRNGYPQWLRNKRPAEARLRRLLHAESFAVTRDECFDLPKRASQVIPVELTGHNAELYDQMAEWMIARIKTGEITEASIKLVQGLRLRQLTSGIARTLPTRQHPDGRLLRVGRDKLRMLEERVIDLWEADERIVVSAVFRPDISAIARLGAKYKVPTFELHGGVSRADRDANIAKFSKLDEAGLFVMQPSAGSLGIDLSAASIFIWFSMTNSWVDFTQAEDRIALSQRPTIYEYLLCPGIDYVIYNDLGEDGDLAKAIVESPDKLSRNFKNTEN